MGLTAPPRYPKGDVFIRETYATNVVAYDCRCKHRSIVHGAESFRIRARRDFGCRVESHADSGRRVESHADSGKHKEGRLRYD